MLLLKRKIKQAYFSMRETPYHTGYYYFDVYILSKDHQQIKETICKRIQIKTLSQDVDYELVDNLVLRITKIKGLQLSANNTIIGIGNFEILEG